MRSLISCRKKSKRERDIESGRDATASLDAFDCDVVDAVADTLGEIGDAVSYYFLNPSKLSYDFAFSSSVEDLIFPVSTN
ncbi:hypothetical protein HJC23_002825 [Cyclotella cryptica]|uniref:Uncharacterized protein n=1 Tax=Cyclotella cryptica TaxID=29204 RepID=A0ABD3PSR8_9STRA|eukprot:CCRYP_013091-RA/>CCRYP_013091-RA protein AED:0.35 eAED:0.35 QI:0/-1/0/1/-1/1/1/0/79